MKTESLETLLKAFKQITNTLPSLKMKGLSTPKVGNSPKLPGVQATTKKNPVKVAEQIKNKDIKDEKMKEAQAALKINKSTGQWSLEKSEKEEIEIGTKEEKEHLPTLKEIAADAKADKLKPMTHYLKGIAKEHVDQIKDYYSRHEKMEAEAKKDLDKSSPDVGTVESLSLSTNGQWSLNKSAIKVSTGSNIVYAGKTKDGTHRYHLKMGDGAVKEAHVQTADIGGKKRTFVKENENLSNSEKSLVLNHHQKNIKD